MRTKSVTSFGERAVGVVEVPGGCAIDRTPRGLRHRRERGARLVVIASGDDDDSVNPDLEIAVFDAP
jgi:hypothetical protein